MEKEVNTDFKDLLIGFGVIILYFIFAIIPSDLLSLFGININNLNDIIKQLYLVLCDSIFALILIYIYRKDIIPNIKDFFKNLKYYLDEYFKYFLLSLVLMVLSNLIVSKFTANPVADNQQGIVDNLFTSPIYIITYSCLLAPIIEEIVFRFSFRKIFKHSNIIFIFLSGLFFGFLHVAGATTLSNYLFIIPYSIPGFIFAYTLVKSKNICVPISLHFFNNFMMLIMQLIALI